MPSRDSEPALRPREWTDWIRYSGASVIITVNPWHWRWIPWARLESNLEWPSPNERTVSVGWLMITLRVWIDDGSW